MKKLIIDTDAGIDDAQAIMMALAHPEADIAAITMVSGNVHLDYVTQNVARVLDICEVDVPFYQGAAGPLIGAHISADHIHGQDGLGDTGYPVSQRQPEAEHAANALIRLCDEAPGAYTLVTLGPLTNVALAARLDPTLPSKLDALIIMGGTIAAHGNATWTAEYNIYADPEALHIVFDTFPMSTLVSWETTVAHPMSWDWFAEWVQTDTEKGRFMEAITRSYTAILRRDYAPAGCYFPDPLAMAVALEPELVLDAEQHRATVELKGEHTRGQTIIDYNDFSTKPANTRIVTRVDMRGFRRLLEMSLQYL